MARPVAYQTPRFYRLRNSEAVLAVVCLGPAVLVLAIILAYPVVYQLGLAFFSKNVLNPNTGAQFVGVRNFIWLFVESPRFKLALFHSVLLTIGDVCIEL